MADEVTVFLLNMFLSFDAIIAALLVGLGYRAHVDGDYSRASWQLGTAVLCVMFFFKLLLS